MANVGLVKLQQEFVEKIGRDTLPIFGRGTNIIDGLHFGDQGAPRRLNRVACEDLAK
jgi:hypothetical protein